MELWASLEHKIYNKYERAVPPRLLNELTDAAEGAHRLDMKMERLHTELPPLLAAVSPRVGSVDRVIYDETRWAPASLRIEFRGRSVILEGSSDASTNTLSVIGEGFGRLVLLVVPPYTNPTRAYTAVMAASKHDNVSTPDELLGIGQREAHDRRLALLAHQRWESEGGALRRLGHERSDGVVIGEVQEVRRAE
jgi:Family of unknown function (DUF5994)